MGICVNFLKLSKNYLEFRYLGGVDYHKKTKELMTRGGSIDARQGWQQKTSGQARVQGKLKFRAS
jgi:hypothetical protein